MDELIIIGAGPMGLYAGYTAGLRDLNGRILESSYTYGGQVITLYSEKKIYDVPGFQVLTGKDLINNLYLQYKRYEDNFPLHLNTEVYEIIKKENHYIVNTSSGSYLTKKILITDGGGKFKPKPLELDNELLQDNILYSVTNKEMFRDKDVLILGGGDSAADWALDLKDIAKNITLVHRRDKFRAHQATINEIEGSVNILTPYVVKDIIGDAKVSEVVLENVNDKSIKNIKTDYLLVFYGVNNTKSNANVWNINTDKNGIIVNTLMQTNLEGIYAAGNAVSYPGKLKMIVTGMGEIGTAIGAITNELYPDRKTNNLYSSMLIKE